MAINGELLKKIKNCLIGIKITEEERGSFPE